MSTADNTPIALPFLLAAEGRQRLNEAIGVDENTSSNTVIKGLRNRSLNYTYANGSSVEKSLIYWRYLRDAMKLRDSNGPDLVYAWTGMNAFLFKYWLDLGLDAILTALNSTEDLKMLISSAKWSKRFAIATTAD